MLSVFLKNLNQVWLFLVAIVLVSLLIFPDWLSRDSISELLNNFGTMALIVYIVLSLTRSLLMIPCTPFVLAGAISFPQWPLIVFVISFTGIVLGAFLVYSFPSFGNYRM